MLIGDRKFMNFPELIATDLDGVAAVLEDFLAEV